ncbi:MAG: hypothetical protein ACRDAU_07175 [Clostridium sp.]
MNKELIKNISAENLYFREVPFIFPIPFIFSDIHQVEALIKCDSNEIFSINSGNIFTFSGKLKISFLLTEDDSYSTKIVSTVEAFTFSFSLSDIVTIKKIEAFNINFITTKNKIKGSITLIFIVESTEFNSFNKINDSVNSLDSIFL